MSTNSQITSSKLVVIEHIRTFYTLYSFPFKHALLSLLILFISWLIVRIIIIWNTSLNFILFGCCQLLPLTSMLLLFEVVALWSCNNVFSTYSICRACVSTSVNKFVLISSDKAVRPTNVMGASKRLLNLLYRFLWTTVIAEFLSSSPINLYGSFLVTFSALPGQLFHSSKSD